MPKIGAEGNIGSAFKEFKQAMSLLVVTTLYSFAQFPLILDLRLLVRRCGEPLGNSFKLYGMW